MSLGAQSRTAQPDSPKIEGEALGHYQALLRFDTSATERAEAEYLKRVLDEQGIPARILATDPERPNVVARLKGSGRKRPLLLMGHLDTVPVDASKWKFPPFSATRDGGFVYGRGAIDDKDNLAAALMTMLLLKRQNVALDRDVILLAESGEESAQQLGLGFMVAEHYPEIDAEFCIAEGGDTIRERGEVRYAAVQVTEKVVRGVELTARGISGHGSVPLTSNPIAHLGNAVGKFVAWQPEVRIDETTGPYFKRLAALAPPEKAKYYRDLLSPDAKDGERRGRLAVRERAAPRVDGAHVGLPHHLQRRLSLQRHSVGSQGPPGRADAAWRKPRRLTGPDQEGHQRPRRRRAVRGREEARAHRSRPRGSTPTSTPRWRRRCRASTACRRCRR